MFQHKYYIALSAYKKMGIPFMCLADPRPSKVHSTLQDFGSPLVKAFTIRLRRD